MSTSLARERLERSRQILLREIQGPAPRAQSPARVRPPLRAVAPPQPAVADEPTQRRSSAPSAAAPRRRKLGFISTARDVASLWWHHHPARTGLALVEPALSAYGRRRPFALLATAAGTGAAMVTLRAWRYLPLAGLAAAALRSSQFTSLAASLVAAGAATLTFQENPDENEREELHAQR